MNQIKKDKSLNEIFSKDTQMANKHMKNAQHHWWLRKCKSKLQDTTSYPEYTYYKKKKKRKVKCRPLRIQKDTDKLESLYTAGGNVKCTAAMVNSMVILKNVNKIIV